MPRKNVVGRFFVVFFPVMKFEYGKKVGVEFQLVFNPVQNVFLSLAFLIAAPLGSLCDYNFMRVK